MDWIAPIIMTFVLIIGGVGVWFFAHAEDRPPVEVEVKKPMRLEPRDQHERNHWPEAGVIRGCEIAEQRSTGRNLGPDIIVTWRPGLDEDVDIHGRWLEKHGKQNGVFVSRL